MKLLRFIMVCAAVSLVAATAGFAQHVQTDFDHQANFGQYKTYSWQEIKPGASLWDSRIKSAVNAQLEAKGLLSHNHATVLRFPTARDEFPLVTAPIRK
jgi:Domain of unknown function (DUF4136)